jgi:hypothetical protein
VLLTTDGPRLIDFGIAAGLGSPGVGLDGSPAGTRGFVAPEQLLGGTVEAASDVYSFGETLAFARTGERPAADGSVRVADAGLREVIGHCLRPDPAARPALGDLLGHLASEAGARTGWPPAAIRADIDRRAGEARNPPALPPAPAPARAPVPVRVPARRRTVLFAGAVAVGVVAAGGAVAVLRPGGSGLARPAADGSGGATVPTPVPPASPTTRTVEIYTYGRTTVTTLTTVINGQAETVQAPPLPYRRTVQVPSTIRVPPVRGSLTWRIAFRCTTGNIRFVVTVDGYQVWSGGQSTTGPEITDELTSED